jgi:predicted lysophospholipase L1 biosynthesis ABC-type transport system permease subunit
VVNDRFARRFWPRGDALGKKIKYSGRWMTVVGVARSIEVPGEDDPAMHMQFYQSMPGAPDRAALIVKSSIPPALLEPQLRRAVREVNANVRFRQFTDADGALHAGRATHRFMLALLGVFAVLAVILTAVGLYAVVAYSVFQRRREIGIRVALGAPAPRIARLIVSQGVALSAAGIAIGIVGAAAATRSMGSLLYRTAPGDPLTSAAVALVLLVVSVLACALPAHHATRIDPV